MNNTRGNTSNNRRRSINRKHKKNNFRKEMIATGERLSSMPWRIISGILLIVLSAVGIFSILSYIVNGAKDQSMLDDAVAGSPENMFGKVGAYLSEVLVSNFSGYTTVFYFIFLFLFGLGMLFRHRLFTFLNVLKYFFLTIVFSTWGAVFLSFVENVLYNDNIFGYGWGGQLGYNIRSMLSEQIGTTGLVLALIVSMVIVLLFYSSRFASAIENTSVPNVSREDIKKRVPFSLFGSNESEEVGKTHVSADESFSDMEHDSDDDIPESKSYNNDNEDSVATGNLHTHGNCHKSAHTPDSGLIIEKAPEAEVASAEELEKDRQTKGLGMKFYKKPSVDILKSYPEVQTNPYEIEENQKKIVETLKTFRISVTTNKATIGPTVTLYEVIPNSGVKVESILSSQANLSMALKSEGVRIVPMPENGFVGIEVPNSTPQIVSMKSILISQRFAKAKEKMQLPVGIGKSITNEPYIFDLAKTPHLLVAGATGQGKSVGLNAIITSLLYAKTPDELKFVLIDPKMLEFAAYEDLRNHFLACIPNTDNPIVTDMDLVVPTLNSVCIEMDERYKLLAQAKVKNLKEYNQAIEDGILSPLEHRKLPYIVIVIDEFADLIMTSGKEVETPIARIAQKARAAGIHMIIATQRPSTKVITGLIKSNFPARMSFKVVQANDSRIILDNNGAENLIGRGDMLFSQGSDMVRLQCAFMDNDETDKLVKHIYNQESDGMPFLLPEVEIESEQSSKSFDPRQKDELFEEAARLIVETGVGSTSNIQRRMNIGFNRAGRIMDQLEGAGIVGPQIGSKPRELKIMDIVHLEEILKTMK